VQRAPPQHDYYNVMCVWFDLRAFVTLLLQDPVPAGSGRIADEFVRRAETQLRIRIFRAAATSPEVHGRHCGTRFRRENEEVPQTNRRGWCVEVYNINIKYA